MDKRLDQWESRLYCQRCYYMRDKKNLCFGQTWIMMIWAICNTDIGARTKNVVGQKYPVFITGRDWMELVLSMDRRYRNGKISVLHG